MKKKIIILLSTFSTISSAAVVHEMDHGLHQGLDKINTVHTMNHGTMIKPKLKLEGNIGINQAETDLFATIQKSIRELEANPETKWNKISIERLRLHLIKMQDMTLNVNVEEVNIENGFKALIMPTSKRAMNSIDSVFKSHPNALRAETGWIMTVKESVLGFEISVTTTNPAEIDKIRALGYLGIMTYGDHHQKHHEALVREEDSHQ